MEFMKRNAVYSLLIVTIWSAVSGRNLVRRDMGDFTKSVFANFAGSSLIARLSDLTYGDDETGITEDPEWPSPEVIKQFGQVSAVAVNRKGEVYVFQRDDSVWDMSAFDMQDNYKHKDKLITVPTIYIFDPNTGEVIDQWGENLFYMPHGLTIDHEENLWATDVAMHMVFKFSKGERTPSLSLGQKFVPGNDLDAFCKPTDVAVAHTGDFFVSDGYCNQRILKFDKEGKHPKVFTTKDMTLPHSLTLIEDMDLICTAEREYMRIFCFTAGIKNPKKQGKLAMTLKQPEIGRVYAIAFNPADNLLYGVRGASALQTPSGFVTELSPKSDVSIWKPKQVFLQPHDIDISPDGKIAYVVDVDAENRKKVYKFYLNPSKSDETEH